jgi:PilZ domain
MNAARVNAQAGNAGLVHFVTLRKCALWDSFAPPIRSNLEIPFRVQPLFAGGFMYSRDRLAPRFNFNIPVRIRRLDESGSLEHAVQTSNLSEGGMYFLSDIPLEMDTPIRAYLVMPEQIFGKPVIRWCCDGRVVRLDPSGPAGCKLVVGISFHTYAALTAGRLEPNDERRSLRY